MTVKYLLVNSRLRDSGLSSNFRMFFEKQIVIKSYICLNYLVMPRNNYLINNSNNILKINFSNDTTLNINIAMQNYSPVELSNQITTLVNNQNNFVCSYNANNYKFTFQANIPFNIDFSINNLYRIFSLPQQILNSDDNNKIITNIINFNFPAYLNLNITNIPQNVLINTNQNSLSNNFIIPLSTINFSSIIEYNNVNYNIKMFVKDCALNYFDILITTDYDEIYDGNNSDFFAIFEFDTN